MLSQRIRHNCVVFRRWLDSFRSPVDSRSRLLVALSLFLSCPMLCAADDWKVGAATSEMLADDSMVIGGGIGPGFAKGQEGKLQATAIVIEGEKAVCLVAVDILMMDRDYLDQAARAIEKDCGIPFDAILINSSHTHHAPSTVTVHGYQRDEEFCKRTVAAIVEAAKKACALAKTLPSATPHFRLGQEATVGQNSRQLLKDGKVFWIGPREDFVRPTGPFDVDLPVIALKRDDNSYAGVLFNHSTHCIGTRSGKRSPSFYGLAAQELAEELGSPVAFLSGAAGSTHNLVLNCDEMVIRMKSAVKDALAKAEPMKSSRIAAIRREVPFQLRSFDEEKEDRAVVEYCRKYAPDHADAIIKVFRDSRAKLKSTQGQTRPMWLQAVQLGDVYLVGVPAEFFTTHGLEIKRRSPYRNTFVCGLTNDYVGYLPDRKGFELGGYQTWAGLHSFSEIGTGEMVVEESLKLLNELNPAATK
jgi:neutral ceramidase